MSGEHSIQIAIDFLRVCSSPMQWPTFHRRTSTGLVLRMMNVTNTSWRVVGKFSFRNFRPASSMKFTLKSDTTGNLNWALNSLKLFWNPPSHDQWDGIIFTRESVFRTMCKFVVIQWGGVRETQGNYSHQRLARSNHCRLEFLCEPFQSFSTSSC